MQAWSHLERRDIGDLLLYHGAVRAGCKSHVYVKALAVAQDHGLLKMTVGMQHQENGR